MGRYSPRPKLVCMRGVSKDVPGLLHWISSVVPIYS